MSSKILDGAAFLVKGWHPADPEGISPYEFGTREQELMAARETAWLGVYLMVGGRQEVYGPDAVKALNQMCVNRDFSTLKPGNSRHAIMCNEKGQITTSGVVIRTSENSFRTYALFPGLAEFMMNTDLDVKMENIDEYFIQIDGPKSLEILEEASQCDIHDLKFAQNKLIRIGGTEVFIHRLGMSGSLAYEIHGPYEHVDMVYETIAHVGEKYGIRRQGVRTYMSNHTTGGYPNQFGHFTYPDSRTGLPIMDMWLGGSASDDVNHYYVTPYDVGWGGRVSFDHDFKGKEALKKLSENPPRVPVTLEWDLEDVMKVYAGEIDGTGVEAHEGIFDFDTQLPEFKRVHADKVMVNGKFVGIASGRVRDYYHKAFISLAFMDKEYAMEGNIVHVMWGKPGKPQTEIRAKIARFPYYNGIYRNESCDVNQMIPCWSGK